MIYEVYNREAQTEIHDFYFNYVETDIWSLSTERIFLYATQIVLLAEWENFQFVFLTHEGISHTSVRFTTCNGKVEMEKILLHGAKGVESIHINQALHKLFSLAEKMFEMKKSV